MDVKDAESKEFVSIYDISFLKRKFVPSIEFNTTLAPLDEDSIFKSLTVWTRSRTISKEEQMAEIIVSASREYFMYGKEKFNNMRCFFLNMIHEYDLDIWLPNGLPSYDEIAKQNGYFD
jgi:hypothetical protein